MNCCYNVIYCSYRVLFWCSRWLYPTIEKRVTYHAVHPSKTPWLWVGAEMANGKMVTVTDIVNKYIEYGDRVDTRYLEIATNIHDEVRRWLYLDSKTLVEEEFPPEGILINDDSQS